MTSTTADFDKLVAEAEQSRSAHHAAQAKLAEAQAQRERQEAERADRNAEIARRYAVDHCDFTSLRKRVHEAESKIVDAVRAGRNPITAYRDYRVTVAVGLSELSAHADVINTAAQAQRRRRVEQLNRIQQQARDLPNEFRAIMGDGGSIADPGPALLTAQQSATPRRTLGQWRQAVADWHRSLAEFEGRDPGDLTADHLKRMPAPIGTRPYGTETQGRPGIPTLQVKTDDLLSNAYTSLDQAITAALHKIEAEEIEKAAQQRTAEITKLQQNG